LGRDLPGSKVFLWIYFALGGVCFALGGILFLQLHGLADELSNLCLVGSVAKGLQISVAKRIDLYE
jgi:hypothetical protein